MKFVIITENNMVVYRHETDMWPVELLPVSVAEGSVAVADATSLGTYVDLYAAFGPAERFAVHLVATVVLATVVLGLVPESGSRTIRKCRRSSVISLAVGLPLAAILAALSATGYLLLGTSLGTFFGIFLVVAGLLSLPTWTALGFVAVGESIANRLGTDRRWVGVLLGGLVSGMVTLEPVVLLSIGGLVAAVGAGAGVRVLLGFRSATDPRERAVPPANKV